MAIKTGLKNSLNRIRELSSEIYHQYMPIIDDNTSIQDFATPILTNPTIYNEFIPALIQRIVYTQFEIKYFNNPLKSLEGEQMPLGYIGQEIYTNPARGRRFDINDYAGLLQQYDADVKVQYMSVNHDVQYPVTFTRAKLKQAFTSWEALDNFIGSLTNSLYNGAYIDDYRFTKYLISSAYSNNAVNIETVTAPTTKELAETFITQARTLFLNMQSPSTQYNAWAKVGGYGKAILTWSNPEDIVFIVRNDIRAFIDVNVLATSFNMDKTDLLGNIKTVDNFNVYDDENNLIFDGNNIIGIICDRSWFRIKTQDMYMDQFYNANNRTWQNYLNVEKMFQYSLFANAVIFATTTPNVPITAMDYSNTPEVNLTVDGTQNVTVNVTPFTANTPNITYEVGDGSVVSITTDSTNNRLVTLKGLKAGTTTLTATAGNVTTTLNITVTASA